MVGLSELLVELVCSGRLRVAWSWIDTGSVYSVEFSDNIAGSIGLQRFLAMLRVVTGYPVRVVSEPSLVLSDAVRSVLSGSHPPVRFDGRRGDELCGGFEHEATNS